MKVGVYYNNSDVRVEGRDVPVTGDDDILVKVIASGLCGTDLLEWYRIKRAPLVLGHEPAGEIVEAGKNISKFKAGDRVFVTHHVPCDECYYCRTGHETACKVFQTVNNFDPGGFSQYLKVTGRSINTGTFLIPDEMTYDQASFIEPLGTAVRALRTIVIKPGQSVFVCGTGIAGLLIVKLARSLGAGKIFVTDLSEYRFQKAREYGADYAWSVNEDIPELIRQKNGGRGVDQSILCAGAVPPAEIALAAAGRGATVLFFAVPKPEERIPMDFNPFWRNDITLRTCYGSAPIDNMQACELIRSKSVVVDDMITHRYGINDIGEAFKMGAQPDGCLKIIVEPNK